MPLTYRCTKLAGDVATRAENSAVYAAAGVALRFAGTPTRIGVDR